MAATTSADPRSIDERRERPYLSPSTRPDHGSRRVEVIALIAFSSLIALALRGHAMWFDELQAWNIAHASGSLGDLYQNLRYEGHPLLWYLPLFALTRVTADPRWMQVLTWAIAVGLYVMVLFRSPFPLWARLGICASYFFAFEFVVVSRSYGLTALCWLLALGCVRRVEPRWGLAALFLGLMAWTNVPGAVLASACALVLLTMRDEIGDKRVHVERFPATRTRAACAVLVSSAIAIATCIPPADFRAFVAGLGSTPSQFGTGLFVEVASGLSGAWRGLMPVPNLVLLARHPAGVWNSQVLDSGTFGVVLQACASVVIVVVVARVLRGATFSFRLWVFGCLAFLAFFEATVLPELAHYSGFLFLLFLGCVWLSWPAESASPSLSRPASSRRLDTPMSKLLASILVAQAVATLLTLVPLTVKPFSPAHDIAEAASQGQVASTLVSADDYLATAVGSYLDRPVYSIARHEQIRFVLNDVIEFRGNTRLTRSEAICAANRLAGQWDRPVGLIVGDGPTSGRRLFTGNGVVLLRITQRPLPECGDTSIR